MMILFICSSGKDFCGPLKDVKGPFGKCIEKMDTGHLFENCVFDVCAYDGDRKVLEDVS